MSAKYWPAAEMTKPEAERCKPKWRGRYRDEAGDQHTKIFDRKTGPDGADAWERRNLEAIEAGDWIDPKRSKVTLQAFYDQWSPRQIWLSNTRENAELAMRSCTFTDVPIRQLRRSHAEQWVKTMSAALAPTTLDTRYTIVRGVVRAAIKDKYLREDFMDDVELPRVRRADVAMVLPTTDEVGALLAEGERPSRPGYSVFLALLAFGGLRRGEALGIQPHQDIDFLRRELRVTRQIQRAKAEDIALGKNIVEAAGGIKVVVRPPKYGSERPIHMPDVLVKMIARLLEGRGETAPDAWLFADELGRPWHDNLVDYRFRATRKAAGVRPEITGHDLRHFFASGLIADGCDVVTVQEALGHSKPSITLDTYSHLWPKAEDRTRNAAQALAVAALEAQARHTGRKPASDLQAQ